MGNSLCQRGNNSLSAPQGGHLSLFFFIVGGDDLALAIQKNIVLTVSGRIHIQSIVNMVEIEDAGDITGKLCILNHRCQHMDDRLWGADPRHDHFREQRLQILLEQGDEGGGGEVFAEGGGSQLIIQGGISDGRGGLVKQADVPEAVV